MTRRRLEALLWARAEGTLEAAGRSRLEERLVGDPEARRLAAEVEALYRTLASVPAIPVPAALGERLTAELGALRAAGRTPRPRSASAPRPGLPRFLPAAYVAAGLVLGVIGYHIVHAGFSRGGGVAINDLYGSMDRGRLPGGTEGEGEASTQLEGRLLTVGDGALTLAREDATLWLEARFPADRGATMRLEGGGGLRIEVFTDLSGTGALQNSLDGEVTVELAQGGHVRLGAALGAMERPLRLTVTVTPGRQFAWQFTLGELPVASPRPSNFRAPGL